MCSSVLFISSEIHRMLLTSRVYDIGIDVRFGRGRYRDTRIVTLATRYQLENRTQHTLAFSQRHFVREQVGKALVDPVIISSSGGL